MTIHLNAAGPPRVHPTLTLVPVGAARWRVLDCSGRALGHLERYESEFGPRYRAQRFHAPSRTFRAIGEFWSAPEAADTLRLSR